MMIIGGWNSVMEIVETGGGKELVRCARVVFAAVVVTTPK